MALPVTPVMQRELDLMDVSSATWAFPPYRQDWEKHHLSICALHSCHQSHAVTFSILGFTPVVSWKPQGWMARGEVWGLDNPQICPSATSVIQVYNKKRTSSYSKYTRLETGLDTISNNCHPHFPLHVHDTAEPQLALIVSFDNHIDLSPVHLHLSFSVGREAFFYCQKS